MLPRPSGTRVTFPRPPPEGFTLGAAPERPFIGDDDAHALASESLNFDAGRFSLSIKGVRRLVRSALGPKSQPGEGGRVEEIITLVERELESWLRGVSVTLAPDKNDNVDGNLPPRRRPRESTVSQVPRVLDSTLVEDEASLSMDGVAEVDLEPAIVEVGRSPYNMVWQVSGGFTRFLVHCVARYYNVVSFSQYILSRCASN
jgi:hypothetical protein